ncbi:Nicotinate phosphoribosyltransferase pncB2 [Rhodoplanes serenus]|uniref:Nicotinate phosphoribosyltransferase n=1 Tax=Rhodoplanes serenus TaxID=200615 RepID=A0A3S4FD95_9BRAD|nr:nicotinate phosphoribosyltransferase [Rhodoplanes serenus]VCU11588.1 Nicotinate phosphoribosyltransferase pncB2 [Rhodoplanes serenus]
MDIGDRDIGDSPLLTDLYQLNMMQAYLRTGLTATASFEMFVRRLPPGRSFMMAAGLEQAVAWLEGLRFSPAELAYLERSGRFDRAMLDHLAGLRFTGDVDAMPEGTVFFPDEPLLRITAPLPLAQLLESRLINLVQFQSLIATKAARVMLAAPGKALVDFGFRRAHGAEAGLMAARASYIAGFAGTATVLAEMLWGIPCYGTMAHSYVQAHEDEIVAFESFARARPDNLTLLIDTYDPVAAARKVVALAPKLARDGITVQAVRIDSGDLVALSRQVRQVLDDGGCRDVRIFVSGGLDEVSIDAIVKAGAPIAGFGVGTALTTSQDQPVLDIVYKLQEYDGVARRKRSADKQTWPGRKQVWRRHAADGTLAGDVVSLDGDRQDGTPLLAPVMRAGQRVQPAPSLAEIRARAAAELAALPPALRDVTVAGAYPVTIAPALRALTAEVDRRIATHG